MKAALSFSENAHSICDCCGQYSDRGLWVEITNEHVVIGNPTGDGEIDDHQDFQYFICAQCVQEATD